VLVYGENSLAYFQPARMPSLIRYAPPKISKARDRDWP
jgi:hypothetical protein